MNTTEKNLLTEEKEVRNEKKEMNKLIRGRIY
jgi:hypothetical protein